jgi:tRNA A37 methylthiotransferase MiaB
MDLLERLVAYKANFTLRLRNVNPRWLIPSASHLCGLLETGKIGYILSPVESGSNRVLDRMNRGYRIEDYIEAVRKLRTAYPPLLLKTQIMVGFPGETDQDFAKSRDLLKLGLFDYVEVYAFTKRPRTRASRLAGDVPDKIVTKRYRKLLFRSFFQLPLERRLALRKLKRG